MASTYVIADIHGRFDLLSKAVDAIQRRRRTEPATVVTLGDYIDRGPDSRRVVELLMHGRRDADLSMVNLMGNHEAMMLECLAGLADMSWWIRNGGDTTLASYNGTVPPNHLAWASALKLCHADSHRVYVHAGVDPKLPLNRQSAEYALWVRYKNDQDISYPGKHIVHGHTPVQNGPQLFIGRTNLDTAAYLTGRLVVGVFDDRCAGGPVDLIEVRA